MKSRGVIGKSYRQGGRGLVELDTLDTWSTPGCSSISTLLKNNKKNAIKSKEMLYSPYFSHDIIYFWK